MGEAFHIRVISQNAAIQFNGPVQSFLDQHPAIIGKG